MEQQKRLGRRQFLAGAAGAFAGSTAIRTTARAERRPPVRIQVPDLAFAPGLEHLLAVWAENNPTEQLTFTVAPPESAAASLLNDARMESNPFAGALVPYWTIPDLVRDDFIAPASPPVASLPRSVARLRSFGGEWVAHDFDHSCNLLYWRTDLLIGNGLQPAETWDELAEQTAFLLPRIGGGAGVPQTHSQQVVDHFASMAASVVLPSSDERQFWFDPETMAPSIATEGYQRALEQWRAIARTTPADLRMGSTGDLWGAFAAGRTAYLIASTAFLSYAIDRGFDTAAIGIGELPGVTGNDNSVQRVGNTIGVAWGGVIMRSADEPAHRTAQAFFELLAAPETQAVLWSDPSTGITPVSASTVNVDRLHSAGWPEALAAEWLDAIDKTLSNAAQLPPLRIAETRRYLQALENRIVPYLASSDDELAAAALSAAADDWDAINDAIGVAIQQDLYARSLTPVPEHG